jgi:glycolate oxidase
MVSGTDYGKVTSDIVRQLSEIVGEKNVLTGDDRMNYNKDEAPRAKTYLPDVVVKPGDTASVCRILKLAEDNHIPVTPRGAGTGLSGGAVPILGGISLSSERMKRILEVDEANFSATTEPGVTLVELCAAVEAKGLYYPLYPGEKLATIGGNVSTNAGGMRAVKYGVTRNFVLGLEAVLASGEVVRTGGKYFKCSTAYDLTQLLIGSEGTLAFVTEITVRLITPPGVREILFIPFRSLSDAIGCVPAILKAGILPVGLEFMEKDVIDMYEKYSGKKIPMHDYAAYLMVIIESENEDAFINISERIEDVATKNGAVDIFVAGSEAARANLLEAREKFHAVVTQNGLLDIADVVVPRSKVAEYVQKAKQIGRENGISIIAHGHAGDGNVHLEIMGDAATIDQKKEKETLIKLFEAGVGMGGTISGEHGIGYTKKGYLPLASSPEKLQLMRRIKLAFDPHNIMNPGKVV